MRRTFLTSIAAISAFGAGLGVAHASAGSLPFKSPSAAMFSDQGDAREEARSALNTMLDRFLSVEIEMEASANSSAAAAADPEPAKGECPEEADTKVADAKDASGKKDKKKAPAGPEPVYFAF